MHLRLSYQEYSFLEAPQQVFHLFFLAAPEAYSDIAAEYRHAGLGLFLPYQLFSIARKAPQVANQASKLFLG